MPRSSKKKSRKKSSRSRRSSTVSPAAEAPHPPHARQFPARSSHPVAGAMMSAHSSRGMLMHPPPLPSWRISLVASPTTTPTPPDISEVPLPPTEGKDENDGYQVVSYKKRHKGSANKATKRARSPRVDFSSCSAAKLSQKRRDQIKPGLTCLVRHKGDLVQYMKNNTSQSDVTKFTDI